MSIVNICIQPLINMICTYMLLSYMLLTCQPLIYLSIIEQFKKFILKRMLGLCKNKNELSNIKDKV